MEDWIARDIDHASQRGFLNGNFGEPFNPPGNSDPIYRQEYAACYKLGKDKTAPAAEKPNKGGGCAASLVLMTLAGAGFAMTLFVI